MMVAMHNLGLPITPLQEAQQMVDFGKGGVPGTMFLLEFFTAMDNQSTEVKMGEEPQPQDKPSPIPPAQPQQEMQNLLYSESSQDILDNVWPETELKDATLVRLQAFVLMGQELQIRR